VLTHPSGTSQAIRRRGELNRVHRFIGQTNQLSREHRLWIYGNGYFLRLIEALGNNFSSVKNVLGEAAFRRVARAYLIQNPSTFRSIDDIGAKIAKFLELSGFSEKFPFLADLARVEWAAHELSFADDTPAFGVQSLKTIRAAAWPRAKLKLDPSIRLLTSHWPVNDLWRDDGKWTTGQLRSIKPSRYYFLVHRLPDKRIRIPAITRTEHQLLSALKRGLPLKQALAKIPSASASPAAIQTWFENWARAGIIVGVSSPTD
jgi:hypothetical protein